MHNFQKPLEENLIQSRVRRVLLGDTSFSCLSPVLWKCRRSAVHETKFYITQCHAKNTMIGTEWRPLLPSSRLNSIECSNMDHNSKLWWIRVPGNCSVRVKLSRRVEVPTFFCILITRRFDKSAVKRLPPVKNFVAVSCDFKNKSFTK